MDTLMELKQIRTKINELDEAVVQLIKAIKADSNCSAEERESDGAYGDLTYEREIALTSRPAFFKGKKPTGIIFPDGHRKNVKTWKNVAEELLADCCRDGDKKKLLMDMREIAAGQKRKFLQANEEGMRSPIKIDEGLFFETHYDTESLIRIVTTRILSAARYDYSEIVITVRI